MMRGYDDAKMGRRGEARREDVVTQRREEKKDTGTR